MTNARLQPGVAMVTQWALEQVSVGGWLGSHTSDIKWASNSISRFMPKFLIMGNCIWLRPPVGGEA